MNCPHCSGRDIGRIAPEHYYCWDCCVEFERGRDGWRIFSVDDEGQLVPLEAPCDAQNGALDGAALDGAAPNGSANGAADGAALNGTPHGNPILEVPGRAAPEPPPAAGPGAMHAAGGGGAAAVG